MQWCVKIVHEKSWFPTPSFWIRTATFGAAYMAVCWLHRSVTLSCFSCKLFVLSVLASFSANFSPFLMSPHQLLQGLHAAFSVRSRGVSIDFTLRKLWNYVLIPIISYSSFHWNRIVMPMETQRDFTETAGTALGKYLEKIRPSVSSLTSVRFSAALL